MRVLCSFKPKLIQYIMYCFLFLTNTDIGALMNGGGRETKLPIFVTMPYDHHHAITPIELYLWKLRAG